MADNYISKTYLVSNLKNFKTEILDKAYASLLTTYTKTEVDNLISAIPKFEIKVVSSLPTTDISNTTIYLLTSESASEGNIYTEYIYVNNKWESLGSQRINLDGYYTSDEVDGLLDNKVDKVTGKGLSSTDFTQEEKTKLSGIETGAQKNVQADWNETSTTSDSYIKNVPTDLLHDGDIETWATENDIASKSDITAAIQNLDAAGTTSIPASQTIKDWSESDGIVSITTQNISITKSQISDFPTNLLTSGDITSTYSSTDTTKCVNGVAVYNAVKDKADSSAVPTVETSNIDFNNEWNTTPAALG